jgi:hypothetical protein
MNKQVQIVVNGWRPWGNSKSGLIHRFINDEDYLKRLRLMLDAIYSYEVRKYNEFKGIEEDILCPSTTTAAEIQTVDIDSKPTSLIQTQQKSLKQLPAPSAENT